MQTLRQYERVCVHQLLKPPGAYDGWGVNQRPPQVGDVGYVVDILHTAGVPDRYVVEMFEPDGETIWLVDFAGSELEPVE